MTRAWLSAAVVGFVGVTGAAVAAGGWAVITVEDPPQSVEAGVPAAWRFSVRQHGLKLAAGLTGTISAKSGTRTVTAEASDITGKPGYYAATLVLPEPGLWTVTIRSWGELTLLPIVARPAGASAALPQPAERGRHLFVAKGCAACHATGIAPGLPASPRTPQMLARILTDPDGTLTPSRPFVRMPNLGLKAEEITSLVAFLDSGRTVASR
jgi:hypothetical protein